MTELVHDAPGERFYETGVSKAILFPHTGGAYVWNGMTAVSTNPTGGEPEKYYFDGKAYLEIIKAEEFSASISCVNTPKAFDQCEGIYQEMPGMYTHFNPRIKFNLVWVTKIANDQDQNLGYYLHIVYNCQALPSSRNYQTITDSPAPESRSISITSTPACGIYSYYKFDSREADVDALLSDILLGELPPCSELSVGVPLPPSEEDVCINLVDDFSEFNPGQPLDLDIEDVDADTEVIIKGVINNGLDVIEFPANGDITVPDGVDATPVGSGDILADADDATYVESAEGDLGYTIGLPLLTGGYTPGATFELHIRMSIDGGVDPEDPDNLDAEAQVHIATDAGGLSTVGGFSDGSQEGMAFKLSDVEGNIVDYIVPLRMEAWVNATIGDVVAALEAGAYLNILGASNFNSDADLLPVTVKVYEAKIVLVNSTDGERYLRADDSDDGWIIKYIWNSGHSDYLEGAFTTQVDFKIKSTPFDTDMIGVEKKILNFSDDIPGNLQAEIDAADDTPLLAWRDEDSVDPDVTIPVEYDKWYRVRTYFTFGLANVKVWDRDASPTTYLMDRDIVPSEDPKANIEHDAGKVGNANITYEVVYDNSQLLANCLEEVPLGPFTLDLPAWHANLFGGGGGDDYDTISTPDTGTEMVIGPGSRIGVGYFAEEDHGAVVSGEWIYMPDTPDGYELVRATYVVIAYREENRGSVGGNTSPMTGYTPSTGLMSAFLNCESSGTSNNYAIGTAADPLPVAAYDGENLWEGNEVLSRLTAAPGSQLPCTRLWNEWAEVSAYSATNEVHVAYYAIRLFYEPA